MKFHIRYPYADRMLCGKLFATARVPFVSTANHSTDEHERDNRVTCASCIRVALLRDEAK